MIFIYLFSNNLQVFSSMFRIDKIQMLVYQWHKASINKPSTLLNIIFHLKFEQKVEERHDDKDERVTYYVCVKHVHTNWTTMRN